MRKISEKFKWFQLLLGFILIALGVITIVIAANGDDNNTSFAETICLVWAIVLFVVAGATIIVDFLAFSEDVEYTGLISAGLCIGVGLFVLINKDIINQVIKTLVPYMLLGIGGVLVGKTILLAIKRVTVKKWVTVFVVSVIFITAGVVFLVVNQMLKVIYIVIGGLFIVLGSLEIVGFITRVSQSRYERKQALTDPRKDKRARKGKKKKGDQEVVDGLNNSVYNPGEQVDATPKALPHEEVQLIGQSEDEKSED